MDNSIGSRKIHFFLLQGEELPRTSQSKVTVGLDHSPF